MSLLSKLSPSIRGKRFCTDEEAQQRSTRHVRSFFADLWISRLGLAGMRGGADAKEKHDEIMRRIRTNDGGQDWYSIVADVVGFNDDECKTTHLLDEK